MAKSTKTKRSNRPVPAATAVAAVAISITLAGPCAGTDLSHAMLNVHSVVTSSSVPDPVTIAESLLARMSMTAIGGDPAEAVDPFAGESAETDSAGAIDTEPMTEPSLVELYDRFQALIARAGTSDPASAALEPVIEKLAARIAAQEDATAERLLSESRAFWTEFDRDLEALRAEKAAFLGRA
jgi:hypothetical protein